MAQKPSIPKGTRDFSPSEVVKRNYIIQNIREQFEKFGFQPIETPSFENSETLMGKYGDEGDRLIFKILDSGEFMEKSEFDVKLKTYLDKLFNVRFFKALYDELPTDFFRGTDDIISEFDRSHLETIESDLISKLAIYRSNYLDKLKEIDLPIGEKIDHILGTRMEIISKATQLILLQLHFYPEAKILPISNINRLIVRLISERENPNFSAFLGGKISGKALRYDLTVPFARYVVQHRNEIEFPFKRYQIQPVWRADRPQKGRFREFFQCDADVVGSDSLWQEVEFVQLYDAVFTKLGLEGVTIKMNNRKVLSGFAEVIGESEKLIDFTVALDKLDKIGEEGVKKEMQEKGISSEAIQKIQKVFDLKGTFSEKIEVLKGILDTSEIGRKGIEELEFINSAIGELGLGTANLDLDVTLARGLNYYTGAIFEVSAPEGVAMGSIGGGGRYDDLTGIFGMSGVSGVGISFGLDRIYLVLEELQLFPETVSGNIKALFINFGDKESLYCLKAIKELRTSGIPAELYPEEAKMKKQMNHANKREIPFVILAGAEEIEEKKFTLKNMKTGEQERVSLENLISTLK